MKEADRPSRTERERRSRQAERLARVLNVFRQVAGRVGGKPSEIAQDLGVSERTVYRDLKVLEHAGVPVFFDETLGRHRLRYDTPLPGLPDKPATIWSEAVGERVTDAFTGVSEIAESVFDTTAGTDRERDRGTVQETARRTLEVNVLQQVNHTGHETTFSTLLRAFLTGRAVKGRYRSPYESGPIDLVIHPYRLCFRKRAWYLVGRNEEETDPKTFRVARFQRLSMSDSEFDAPEDFDLTSYFSNAWAVFRGEQTYDVTLKFEATAANIVTETHWHATQKVNRHRDGRATLRFRVDGLNEIARWVYAWSDEVTVIEPIELREIVNRRLERAQELNGG